MLITSVGELVIAEEQLCHLELGTFLSLACSLSEPSLAHLKLHK
ncbi:hypothetical protein VEx25_1810 [Vibrio antiquarius]|uniref:Uncharacterized protein n=1 Tax=Vibrio antiquarius (strain Ex25) TaxID=150340 RepID=A0ABM9WY32_VIBAE|nr:hypothetical protein VEx25_1810 [Vibrio antiquarius]